MAKLSQNGSKLVLAPGGQIWQLDVRSLHILVNQMRRFIWHHRRPRYLPLTPKPNLTYVFSILPPGGKIWQQYQDILQDSERTK